MTIQDRECQLGITRSIILKTNVEDKCRKCGIVGENIEHKMGGCSAFAENSYLNRHNQLAKLVHQQLGIKYGLLDDPAPVLEKSKHQPLLG